MTPVARIIVRKLACGKSWATIIREGYDRALVRAVFLRVQRSRRSPLPVETARPYTRGGVSPVNLAPASKGAGAVFSKGKP